MVARSRSNTEASGRFHTDWLNMMYPRLKLAGNLLREDGVICVSIDDHEACNLRLVLTMTCSAQKNFSEVHGVEKDDACQDGIRP